MRSTNPWYLLTLLTDGVPLAVFQNRRLATAKRLSPRARDGHSSVRSYYRVLFLIFYIYSHFTFSYLALRLELSLINSVFSVFSVGDWGSAASVDTNCILVHFEVKVAHLRMLMSCIVFAASYHTAIDLFYDDGVNHTINYVDENSELCCRSYWGRSNTLMNPCRSNIGGPDPWDPCGIDMSLVYCCT